MASVPLGNKTTRLISIITLLLRSSAPSLNIRPTMYAVSPTVPSNCDEYRPTNRTVDLSKAMHARVQYQNSGIARKPKQVGVRNFWDLPFPFPSFPSLSPPFPLPFPSLSLQLHSLSTPIISPSHPLPSLLLTSLSRFPLRSIGPLKSIYGVLAEPQPKSNLVHVSHISL